MTKLVIIDAMAILHRAFHALPAYMSTKSGEPINAVYGFVSMLLRVIQDLKPTHIAICFDRKEPTFRKKKFKSYQAQRPPTDKALEPQFAKARDVAIAFGIPIYENKGFEADDLIGTISNIIEKKDLVDETIIVTGDKDQFQLVTEKTKVYVPIKGLSNAKLFGPDEVEENMGVIPSQIADYKALVGDPSDNYFGVPGIGPKTAVDLLQQHKSFEGVYKHLKDIKGSVREKLETERKSAEMSYFLAQIITDMDIEFDIEKARKWKVDSPEVLALFNDYGFKTLTKRVKEVGKSIIAENQGELF